MPTSVDFAALEMRVLAAKLGRRDDSPFHPKAEVSALSQAFFNAGRTTGRRVDRSRCSKNQKTVNTI